MDSADRPVIVFEWTFSPPDYFEQTIDVKRDAYLLRIETGKAEARVDPLAYDADPEYRIALHKALEDRFLAVQVLTHRAYQLAEPSIHRVHPDGHRDFYCFLKGERLTLTECSADFVLKDKDGNVVTDTKMERTQEKERIANLVAKYRSVDEVLDALVNSYAAAVRDPDNELVHLFELREAITVKFGSEGAARAAIDLSGGQWTRLGRLANEEPLKQGRHRGAKIGQLRDATEAEMNEVRSTAQLIIKGYLAWLDSPGGGSDSSEATRV